MRWVGPRLLRLSSADEAAYPSRTQGAYAAAWARPGRLTATANYYCALRLKPPRELFRAGTWPMPVLVIWGERDTALLPDLADGLGRWIPNLRVVKLPHALHWVMRTEPVRVLNELLAFFNER